MEVTTLNSTGASGLRGPTPLLRLQSDERLVTLTRKGNQAAYEALVARYQSRLLAFCRHMLSSKEDAEDVLQEVFAASYSALMADDRAINVRPWFYRIARNRSLNHLRKRTAVGVDSMDVHLADNGTTTADRVHQREEFRLLMGDVGELAETQRTALLLREIDNLSYDQIAEAMDTTVSSVKSLLVRARVSLAEASEARAMPCDEVRADGEVAEGLSKLSPAARRHCRQCERCGAFRDHLKATNKTLALMLPVAPFLLVKKLFLAHLGTTSAAGTTATAVGATAGSAGAGSLLSASVATIASKTAAGLAAAAIVTAGAVEVDRAQTPRAGGATPVAEAIAPVPVAPQIDRSIPQPTVPERLATPPKAIAAADDKKKAESRKDDDDLPTTTPTETTPVETTPAVTTPVETTPTVTTPVTTTPTTPTTPTVTTPQTGSDTTVLPPTVVTDHAGGTVTTPSTTPPVTSGEPAPSGDSSQPTTTTPAPPAAAPAPPPDATTTAPAAPPTTP